VLKRRPGLWTETALGLGLVTLLALVLSLGVVGLLFKIEDAERRTDLAQQSARSLRAQLEAESRMDSPAYAAVLKPYVDHLPENGAIWMVSKSNQPLVVLRGEPAATMDVGVRSALYSKQEHMRVRGSRFGRRYIEITQPIVRSGMVVGAIRYRTQLDATGPFGGQWGVMAVYILLSTTVIAGVGFLLFRRRLVRPILEIQEATDAIAGGAFGQRVEVDGPRELVELSGALSTMSASLAAFRERSEQQLQSLEEANRNLRGVQQDLINSEKLASVGRLAAGIAHELGNPLAAVMGYVELLQQGLDEPELEADIVRRCRAELERIQNIIGDLLDYARPDQTPFAAEEVESMLKEAAERVRVLPQFQAIQIRIELDEGLPEVYIQREKIHQVLLNVLTNAADAMQGRGVIRLQASQENELVSVVCLDEGPGLNEEVLGRLFDPFYTTKEPGKGTGLGLAISHRIVRSQSGELSAGNQEKGGAWVKVQIPVVSE